jgi:metallophosphoesterase (TIGR00282 family)
MAEIRVLMLGDIVGEEAVSFVCKLLPELKKNEDIHFCVANAENAHQGKGINDHIVHQLLNSGVNVITGGDHSFDKHLVFPLMEKEKRLLRPHNYPKGVPGYGYGIFEVSNTDFKIGVINLRGLTFFNNPISCPFREVENLLESIKSQTNMVFIDFHSEATAEKWSFARFLDGKVSAIVGTHTHVQTADEQILPYGTGFITDVGFCGPYNSVIGMDIETSIQRFLFQIPQKYKLAEGNLRLQGVIFEIDTDTGLCFSVKRIQIPKLKTSILDL